MYPIIGMRQKQKVWEDNFKIRAVNKVKDKTILLKIFNRRR